MLSKTTGFDRLNCYQSLRDVTRARHALDVFFPKVHARSMVRNSSDTLFECKTHQFYFFRQQGSFSLLVEARHRQGKDTTFVSSISMVIPRGLARLSTPSLNFRISVLSSYGMHASRPVRLMMSASCRADGVCDNLYENGVLMMTRIKIYLRPTIKGHCGTREVISRIQIL